MKCNAMLPRLIIFSFSSTKVKYKQFCIGLNKVWLVIEIQEYIELSVNFEEGIINLMIILSFLVLFLSVCNIYFAIFNYNHMIDCGIFKM